MIVKYADCSMIELYFQETGMRTRKTKLGEAGAGAGGGVSVVVFHPRAPLAADGVDFV